MGTTTNNGWPTPVASDLVKDGWEAIKDLGDAIDTTLGVYAPSTSGLTLINTTSFSAVSAASAPVDTFTTTYDNYRIVFNATVTNNNVFARLRASGSDDSTSNYVYVANGLTETNTGDNASSGGASNVWHIGKSASSLQCRISIDLFSPKLSAVTSFLGQSMNRTNTSAMANWDISGFLNTTTSYDSISIYPAAGTITGSYSVYGYNK